MTNDLHTYRVLIIDDEAHMRDTLGKFLKRYCPDVRLVGEASGVKSGMKAIHEFHPDLVLLDINMDDGTGFDLLHTLETINFRVIFISAFDKNTIQAMNLSGLEYLAKPINPTDLGEVINRVMKTEIKHFSLQLEALEGNVGR
jgi:two-component system, LytTR family, response regulator